MSTDRSRRPLVIVAAALIAAVAVVVLAVALRDTGTDVAAPDATVVNQNTGPAGDVPRRADDDPLVLGQESAPVTMVVFSELTCAYCVHFATQIQPQLVEKYVDTGRLRIEWRDAPASGPAARTTARAGRAAAAQGRFWEFTDEVVRANPGSAVTVDALAELAAAAGVPDLERFRVDASSTDFDQQIDADLRLAQDLFIPPSPAFWIDGTPLLSGLPLWAFTDAIDGKLALNTAD